LEAVGVFVEVRGVQVKAQGTVLLPVARVAQILRELTDQEIHLEADESKTVIRGQHSEFELPGEDPLLYPELPGFDSEDYHQIQANVLRQMIQRTIFAAAHENARYALTGVLWELGPEKCRLVATDGRRLAVTDTVAIQHGKHGTEGMTPVVPTKAMSLLERNLTDPEDAVLVTIRPNEAIFKASHAVVYGRLVEGRYPPYREVFPKKTTSKVKTQVGPLLSAVRQAAILTDDDSRGVEFDFTPNKMTLRSRVPDHGQSRIELTVEYEGKPVGITFDPRFIIDMLRVLEPDAEVTLDLNDSNSAALFRTGDNYSYIVMPLTRDRH
jgi:DNA polymerase-3 subunit beta